MRQRSLKPQPESLGHERPVQGKIEFFVGPVKEIFFLYLRQIKAEIGLQINAEISTLTLRRR